MVSAKVSEEFNEQVASHYRLAATKGEAQRKLTTHSDELLAQMAGMVGILSDYPVYGGLAFYGKFQFLDKKLITRLAERGVTACEAIDAIRAGKALRVTASTKPAWDCLLKENPEALWVAIQLNLNVKIPYLAPREDEACEQDENEETEETDTERDDYDRHE